MTEQRAAVLYGARDLRLEHRPEPQRQHGDVRVQIEAVGICGSDAHYYQHGRIGSNIVEQPVILGHEASGVVLDDIEGLPAGTRVAIEPQRPCFRCDYCLDGSYNMCRRMEFMADPPTDGALREVVAVPAAFCHPLPDSISFEEGALVEPLAVALWAATRSRIAAGDAVSVVGAGPVGLLAIQVAAALGATDIHAIDVNTARLEVAHLLGATVHDPPNWATIGPGSVDVVVECSGAPGAVASGIASLRPHGRLAAVGIGRAPSVDIDWLHLQAYELELLGVYRYAGIYPAAIRLVQTGKVNLRSLITHRFPITEAALALDLSRTNPDSIKAIVQVRSL